ncbi:MAG: ATP-binding cassette domain-containing protein [Acidobacteriota bacterium]
MNRLLEIKNLKKYFILRGNFLFKRYRIKALDGISFNIKDKRNLGLVGESGSGKSTIAKIILRLLEPTEGKVYFLGRDFSELTKKDTREMRQKIQLIFQEPLNSLNPRHKIKEILEEPFKIFKIGDRNFREEKIKELLNLVGLSELSLQRYPHEFSGGQRQRICLVRAISLSPLLLILDEPLSSLDVSVQSQILNLLIDFQERFNIAYLFISHNLDVVKHISDELVIIYRGKIMEYGKTEEMIKKPLHPYTEFLLNPFKYEIKDINFDENLCPFLQRCYRRINKCFIFSPQIEKIDQDREISCHVV